MPSMSAVEFLEVYEKTYVAAQSAAVKDNEKDHFASRNFNGEPPYDDYMDPPED